MKTRGEEGAERIWRYMFFLRHRWNLVLPDIYSYGKIPGTYRVGS